MRGKARLVARAFLGLSVLFAAGCSEFQEPLPNAPTPPPPPAFSRFPIVGHWEATTDQGRRIAFDVTADGRVGNGRLNFHHDCNVGRWRATIDGFEAEIVDDAFLTTVDWRVSGQGSILAGLTLSGTYTVSGRFESGDDVTGGLVNSITDIREANEQPGGQVCPPIHVGFTGEKEP